MAATLLAICLTLGQLEPAPAADTIVVCPQPFRTALQPWLDYRGKQGHVIHVIDTAASADELNVQIRKASTDKLRAILLIGDARADSRTVSGGVVPTHLQAAKINIHWGSEPQIASDNAFADRDGDSVPDVAIGRLPADTPADLKIMIDKIIRHEQQPPGEWCRRLHFVAGVGGFGALADSVLEMATKKFLTSGIPASYTTTMTYGSWRSPFCPTPSRFHETTVHRLNEGGLFWVYIGHGQRWYLDQVNVPGGRHHIFDVRDVRKLHCQNGAPIAVFLACYTGAYDHPRDCLAEEMLRHEGGPIAVLSGSRVTMPYAMAVMSDGFLTEYFENGATTLGDVVLRAKQQLLDSKKQTSNRMMLDALAAALSPVKDQLREERREHLYLFNLLGDPLSRLPQPRKLELKVPEFNADAGQEIEFVINAPFAGQLTIDFAVRRDRPKLDAPVRSSYNEQASEGYQEIYRQANDTIWLEERLTVASGNQSLKLRVPGKARGLCHIRGLLRSPDGQIALGSTDVFVRRPQAKSNSTP